MRVNARAWTRLDWALAAVCALLVYGITFHGHGFYVFPLGIWAGAWVAPLLAIAVALPVGLRRRDLF